MKHNIILCFLYCLCSLSDFVSVVLIAFSTIYILLHSRECNNIMAIGIARVYRYFPELKARENTTQECNA